MVSVASSCGRTALPNSSHLNETIRARQRAGPGYDSERADMVCHYRELLRAGVKVESPSRQILWKRFRCELKDSCDIILECIPETGNIQRAEEFSADSLISPDSSLFVVHRAENGSLVIFARVLRCPRSLTRSRVWSNGPYPTFLWQRFVSQFQGLFHEVS